MNPSRIRVFFNTASESGQSIRSSVQFLYLRRQNTLHTCWYHAPFSPLRPWGKTVPGQPRDPVISGSLHPVTAEFKVSRAPNIKRRHYTRNKRLTVYFIIKQYLKLISISFQAFLIYISTTVPTNSSNSLKRCMYTKEIFLVYLYFK